eukprot:34577-Pyramimonas_sp.AAC.1
MVQPYTCGEPRAGINYGNSNDRNIPLCRFLFEYKKAEVFHSKKPLLLCAHLSLQLYNNCYSVVIRNGRIYPPCRIIGRGRACRWCDDDSPNRGDLLDWLSASAR